MNLRYICGKKDMSLLYNGYSEALPQPPENHWSHFFLNFLLQQREGFLKLWYLHSPFSTLMHLWLFIQNFMVVAHKKPFLFFKINLSLKYTEMQFSDSWFEKSRTFWTITPSTTAEPCRRKQLPNHVAVNNWCWQLFQLEYHFDLNEEKDVWLLECKLFNLLAVTLHSLLTQN